MARAERPYWLLLRTLPAPDPLAGLALASAIALLAAFAGGVALQRRIARPLKRLEEAVGRMVDPSDPFAIEVDGPREVAAVSRALADMSAQLRAAEADRALMLAGVSHDLRTPLTKLRLALAMLRDADAELVAGAERNVIRIEGMRGQFLDFARGFEAEATRSVPLRSLLQQAIEACAGAAGRSGSVLWRPASVPTPRPGGPARGAGSPPIRRSRSAVTAPSPAMAAPGAARRRGARSAEAAAARAEAPSASFAMLLSSTARSQCFDTLLASFPRQGWSSRRI